MMSLISVASGLKPLRSLPRPIEVIRQFTPSWFAATMGTGVVAVVLGQACPTSPVLAAAGRVLWRADVLLFTIFVALYTARWALWPAQAARIATHPVASLALGTIPMGLATLLNGALVYGDADGIRWVAAGWVVDAALSIVCGLVVPLWMFTRQSHELQRMTGAWLLPIVAAEVAAGTAGQLAPHLAEASARIAVLASGYALWAFSVPAAFGILVILTLRLALHRAPADEAASSTWLALGPIATAALGLMLLGDASRTTLTVSSLAEIGRVAQAVGVVGGLLLWGFGAWWLGIAAMLTVHHARRSLPFNLGWWAYTFPLGVYSLATLRLGRALHLKAMIGTGKALAIVLVLVWLLVSARTLAGAWSGRLFHAPCLEGLARESVNAPSS